MNRAAEREKAFSEDIDRILAGQAMSGEHQDDPEYRNALRFASKMSQARPSPNPEWRAEVRAKLMSLATSRVEDLPQARRGWLDFIRQPVWQATTAAVVLVMVGVLVWASGVFKPASVTPPTSIPTTIPGGTVLSVQASTDQASYSRGQEVRIDVTLRNVTSQPFKVEQFPPILSLMDDATKRPVYTFAAGQGTITLAAGQETRFSFNWNQRDASGATVPVGRYYLELEDVDSQGNPVQLRLRTPVYFDVRAAY